MGTGSHTRCRTKRGQDQVHDVPLIRGQDQVFLTRNVSISVNFSLFPTSKKCTSNFCRATTSENKQ